MIAATIAIQTGYSSILAAEFVAQRSPNGRPDDQVQTEVEPLQSRGTDGTSHRDIGRQWRQWQWQTVSVAANYKAACLLASGLETMQGSTAAIQLFFGGSLVRTYSQVRIFRVQARASQFPVVVAGTVTGPFAPTDSPQAAVTADWILQLAQAGTWSGGDTL